VPERHDVDRPGTAAQTHQESPQAKIGYVAQMRARERPLMRPSLVLDLQRSAVRETTSRFRVANLRVFGSVLRGTDKDGSDLDLLVDPLPGTTLFDLGGLHDELESLLGIRVDLLTPGDLPPKFRDKVLAEARSV
jgi:predicted nucleotidyltransferase